MATIFVSSGFTRYVGGTVIEKTGKDISAIVYQIGLATSGTIPPSTGWVTPSTSTVGVATTLNGVTIPANAQRIITLLITNATALGTYWAWGRVPDSPEIEPILLQGPFTTA